MCDNNRETDCRCINEILTVINVLQQNANCPDSCLDTCDRGFLGNNSSPLNVNTRPVMLYTCSGNGTPWSMPIEKEDGNCTEHCIPCSNAFRIEKIDGCCATFRVLAPAPICETLENATYVATNSFFTMNLECVCCLRCLPDTYVCL